MQALYECVALYRRAGMKSLPLLQSIPRISLTTALPIGFAFTSCAAVTVIFVVIATSFLLVRRYLTWRRLRQNGIPTVYWRPRFINYKSGQDNDQQKMSSSTITNILPRMKRLQGPYDMYGTVYGISTAVVHVAHPTPAVALLASQNQSTGALPGFDRGSLRLQGSGACKEPAYNHFKTFCGNGVFTADGQDWKQKRAAVSHALLKPIAGKSFETKIQDEANRAARKLVQRLRRVACPATITTTSIKTAATPRNILPILQQATVGLIFRYITHVDLEEKLYGGSNTRHGNVAADDHSTASTVSSRESDDENETTSLDGDEKGSLSQLFQSYLQSIVQIRMIILAKSRSIWFLLPQWCYRFFSTMAVDEEFTLIPIRKFSAMACQAAAQGSPLARLQNLPLYQNPTPDGFSKNLVDEAITLLFAGQDTSAATLSWTLHLLSLSPAVQNKLAQQVHTVLGQHNVNLNNANANDSTDGVLNKRVLAKMTYLDAVIKESMRLYPVAPFVVRRLPFAVTVVGEKESAAVTIPADTVACIWIYSLHRHPDFWSRPDDFIPERWLEQENMSDAGIMNGAYMPFAAGPRNCLGQPLAQVILRTLLCQLVANFEFQDPRFLSCDQPHEESIKTLRKDMQAGFTVLPKDGIHLLVRERRD